jgi:monoamine oxidase
MTPARGGAVPAERRRRLLLASALAPWAGLGAGCTRDDAPSEVDGGWVGAAHDRGHALRHGAAASAGGPGATATPAVTHRAAAVVVGAGVAGLGAARALARAGVADLRLVELEDGAGGNSRGHTLAGMRCPLGAHYLPVPGERAVEVVELLEELKVRRTEHGRAVYDERALCHSPQERLYIGGAWREGLLPPVDALPAAERAPTAAQYRAFGAAVAAAGGRDSFEIPTARSTWTPTLDRLDAQTFAAWLDERGLVAPALRWYLDYCCRDDFGATPTQVSAWAGIHYFASRHGFHAPGDDDGGHAADGGEGVLTWPEGNAWLAERLAAPFRDRLRTGLVAMRVREGRHDVAVDAWNVAERRLERFVAPQVVLATPLFVAARLLDPAPPALVEAARRQSHAPWLVANLHLDAPLDDRPGAAPAWDNVLYESPGLGYVDAMHQSLRTLPGPTVLSAYWALGGGDPEARAAQRAALLGDDWRVWSGRVLADLGRAHADLHRKVRRVDLMRYGHAMAIPSPGLRSGAALRALAEPGARVHFAHADLSAYSIFEEALFQGMRAGRAAAARLSGSANR